MTFSVAAVHSGTRLLGAACATYTLAVGAGVPAVAPQVGVVVTQGWTNRRFRAQILGLLRAGASAQAALDEALAGDVDPASRQVAVVDAHGRAAAHTGTAMEGVCGHLIGDGVVVAGNFVSDLAVLEAMMARYDEGAPTMARLLAATLAAGDARGGDARGRMSASLTVAQLDEDDVCPPETLADLRIDDDPDAVRRLVALEARWAGALDEAVAAGRYRSVGELTVRSG